MKSILILSAILGSHLLSAQELYFPSASSETWSTTPPENLKWCETQINNLYDYLDEEKTKSFIILKDGKIVLEKYFGTYTQDSLWFWFSAGKSLIAVLTGIAQQNNLLSIKDRTSNYLGEGWTSLTRDQENAITIYHQLSMSTGLDELVFECTDPACLTYRADAGDRWAYHNGPYSLLRNVLETAYDKDLNEITTSEVKNKTGMKGLWIKSGFNNFFVSRARDMARFGLMIQANGSWDGETILTDQQYYNEMLNSSQEFNPSYGYLWWLNGKASYIGPNSPISFIGPTTPNGPQDLTTAAGAQGQFISISKSEGLVLIRQGSADENDLAPLNLLNEIWNKVLNLECTITSTETKELNIRIFPQPAHNYIQIESGNLSTAIITDILGRPVKSYNGTNILEISDLKTGVYLLTGYLNQIPFRKKFYKK